MTFYEAFMDELEKIGLGGAPSGLGQRGFQMGGPVVAPRPPVSMMNRGMTKPSMAQKITPTPGAAGAAKV
jgi:hypothetical protein